ncbi:MAG: Ig-like domain-containing protein, partial [Gemmatimonadetes bacterium]|nr:Ig-like domain-containing protein [Gemmatimonadota bacterium]
MSFASTRARRLARIRTFVFATAVLLACDGEQALDPGDVALASSKVGVVDTVEVSPNPVSGMVGQSAQFTATVKDGKGNVLNGRTVSWSSSDTNVVKLASSGFGTAVGVGAALIIATVEGKSGAAQATVTGAPVASVALSPASASGTVGQSQQFTAILKDANGNTLTGRFISWASSNEAVVKVDSTGFATAVGAGSATITATSEGMRGGAGVSVTAPSTVTAPGTVTDLAVAGVTDTSLTLSFTDVTNGAGQPASYDVRFAASPMSWASAGSVARGSCSTPVAGSAVGTRLTCTALGLSASTAYEFQVVAYRGSLNQDAVFGDLSNVAGATTAAPAPAPVATVTVDPSAVSGTVGQSGQFTATLKDAAGSVLTGRAVSWSSSNTAVATIDGNGYATATGAGSASIIATSEGKSGQAQVTVTGSTPPPPPADTSVASVTVAPASASVTVGQSQQYTVELRDAAGNTLSGRVVTWSSSSTAVATVDSSGLATAVGAGSASITAGSEGKQGTAAISVSAPPPPPPTVTAPGTVNDLTVASVTDTSATLAFTEVTDGAGQPASYEVRFAVSPMDWGSAAGVSRGSCATPLAGSAIGVRKTCTVLGLSASTGYEFQLVAFRGTLNVNAVFGSLSNVAGATTDAPPALPVASVVVSPETASVNVGQTQQLTAQVQDANGNVLTGRSVTWSSDNALVGTVSVDGLVTAVAEGSATITATSEGRTGSATVSVTAAPPPPPPPSGGTWANEPSGYSLISDNPLDALTGDGWDIVYNTGTSIVPDATAPLSPLNVMESKYVVGHPAGIAPGTVYKGFSSTKRIYVGLWWKPSDPWQGNSSGVNKIQFLFSADGNVLMQMFG